MPYDTRQELPDAVKHRLPDGAQDIYKEAFNSAWQEYKNPKARRDEASREQTSHRVAWAAVKRSYHKNTNNNWVKRGK